MKEGQVKLDAVAYKELRDAQKRISGVWPEGTTDILVQRNPKLLSELDRLESVIDSLLAIPNWPAPIRKQWHETLANYEKTAVLCSTYAKRHITLAAQGQSKPGEVVHALPA